MNMNKKGFTLLEVMSVLLLLAIILLVAIPNITNTIKKDQVNQFDKYEETLCDAAVVYIESENITDTEINVSVLASKHYISDGLSNPKTKKNAALDKLVISRDSNNKILCRVK